MGFRSKSVLRKVNTPWEKGKLNFQLITKFKKTESSTGSIPEVMQAENKIEVLRKKGIEVPEQVTIAQETLRDLRRSGKKCEAALQELEGMKNPSNRKRLDCTALLLNHDKLLNKVHATYAFLHQKNNA